jgi:hypothetical protein
MPWIRGAPHNAPNYGIGSNDGYRRQGRSGLGLPPVSEGLRRSRRIDPISRSAKLLRHQLGRLPGPFSAKMRYHQVIRY